MKEWRTGTEKSLSGNKLRWGQSKMKLGEGIEVRAHMSKRYYCPQARLQINLMLSPVL